MQLSVLIATLIMFLLVVFQALLIMARPLGHYAWGGKQKVLPRNLRIASAISIIIYIFFISIFLDSSKLISIYSNSIINQYGIILLSVYFLIGVFMNAISRSKAERNVMTPVALILLLSSLVITFNR